MKNLITTLTTVLIALASGSAFAEKIVITGQPITLQRQGEVYVAPETYKPSPNYQYVVIDGKERACFLDVRPDLVNLDVVSINVQAGAEKATWNCYATDPTYFVIQR